jgi:hypothetical protein
LQVDHLAELEQADGDEEVLTQGSYFQNRVFFSQISERKLVCELVTGGITPGEFVTSPDITSENGEMLKQLVRDIDTRYQGQIPKVFNRFLTNISKPTSVAGLLQCTGPAALQYLREFANETLHLRHRTSKDKLTIVAKELPAFWPMLLDILNEEKSNFMNPLMATIVKKLLDIR